MNPLFLSVFQKCVQYWPDQTGVYGRVTVVVNSVVSGNGYTVREMTVQVRTNCLVKIPLYKG